MIEVLFVVFFVFVWFETDVLVDYGRAFGLSRLMRIDDWEAWRDKHPRTGYLDYLMVRHRGFFTKLINCERCLSFWLSLFACHFGMGILWTPAVYLASLLGYNLFVWILWKLRRS